MIYKITCLIGKKEETKTVYTKGDAVAHYRLRLSEMSFPDEIYVEELNDGE